MNREEVNPQIGKGLNVPVGIYDHQVRIQRGEMGPVLASLLVRGAAQGCPPLAQEITLYQGIKRIDLSNRLLRDATPLLEVHFAFPFALERPRFAYESSNAVVRPIEDQLPGTNTNAYALQHWASVWDEAGGVTWSSPDAPVMQMGGLWPGYVSQAHHAITPPGYGQPFLSDPGQLTKGHLYSYALANNFRTNFDPVQVSDILLRYAITSHPGDWRAARAWHMGWAASTPLEAVAVIGPGAGSLPAKHAFLRVDAPNALLLAAKIAEDGQGLIIRLMETAGEAVEANLEVAAMELGQAYLTNVVEENVAVMEHAVLEHARHTVRVPLRPYGLATVRCCPTEGGGPPPQVPLWPVEPVRALDP